MKKEILFAVSVIVLGVALSFATDMTQKKLGYLNRQEVAVERFMDAVNMFKSLRTEWDAEGYSSLYQDSDFYGTYGNMMAADLTAIVVSEQAVTDLLASNGNGHYTNLYKIVH